MPLFGSALWGGSGTGTGAPVSTGVPIKNLFYMALRLAHMIKVAQVGASPDQLLDCLQAAQLMISQARIKKSFVLTIDITAYPLVAGTKIYTIGAGGSGPNWLGPNRPEKIEHANLILASGTPIRLDIFLGTDQEWAEVAVQDIPGALPRLLYCDYKYPLSNIYVVPQDMGGDQLELHTWEPVPSPQTVNDLVAYAPGYDDWLVNNLAVRLASMFADEGAYVTDDTRLEARKSAAAIGARNTHSPRMTSDVPRSPGRTGGGSFNYYSGMDK